MVSAQVILIENPQEVSMADEQLNPSFIWRPWRIGDPAVLLESILSQVEDNQRSQITALYLDSVVATLQANLKFVQGVRSLIGGQ